MLYNLKCQQLIDKGGLINPYKYGIQPIIVNYSWLVKKNNITANSLENCTVKDVRLVVGFDPINKYLQDPPGKVTKSQDIYTSMANWNYIGELDFSDFYYQLPFRTESPRDKLKLAYLCIRSAFGTLCFRAAPMGLLGMDTFQDELTDRIFGDLILAGKVAKIADNLYFGGNTVIDLHNVFAEIAKRCATANLRVKPSKVNINLKSADVLGLHWSSGSYPPPSTSLTR